MSPFQLIQIMLCVTLGIIAVVVIGGYLYFYQCPACKKFFSVETIKTVEHPPTNTWDEDRIQTDTWECTKCGHSFLRITHSPD